MKLEQKLYHVFFFQFLLGIILSSFTVVIFLRFFTDLNYDKRTSQNVIKIRKRNSKIIINSVNILLTSELIKLQTSFIQIYFILII
jgi:hypothetical protein